MQNCDDDRLVEAVRGFFCLWDVISKAYRDPIAKGQIYVLDTIMPVVMTVCMLHWNFVNVIYATAGNAL